MKTSSVVLLYMLKTFTVASSEDRSTHFSLVASPNSAASTILELLIQIVLNLEPALLVDVPDILSLLFGVHADLGLRDCLM